MVNIETHHPWATDLLKRGAISMASSCIPATRCTVDNTIKYTFMKHAKSRGGSGASAAGLSGLQVNYSGPN